MNPTDESAKIRKVKALLEVIKNLKETRVGRLVERRMKEFHELGKGTNIELFKELCFCILTANFSAERSIKIQREIGDGFLTLPEHDLLEKLKELGHRFPALRAKYIVEARRHIHFLKEIIESFNDKERLREWLVRNVKGLGYKEASHFLRNIGYVDFAIIDFHIINILAKYGLIEKPRMLTKRRYLQIESLLRDIAGRLNLNLGELDLYLWYIETGKILK